MTHIDVALKIQDLPSAFAGRGRPPPSPDVSSSRQAAKNKQDHATICYSATRVSSVLASKSPPVATDFGKCGGAARRKKCFNFYSNNVTYIVT